MELMDAECAEMRRYSSQKFENTCRFEHVSSSRNRSYLFYCRCFANSSHIRVCFKSVETLWYSQSEENSTCM